MKFILKVFIIFTIFYEILLTNQKALSPLSQCFKGRVSSYTGWEKGGLCGFEPHTNATGPYYIYPIAPNEDLFPSLDHCGVCYEMVGLSGVIRVRVEDYCSKDDESGYCSGDMYHFNLPDIGLNYLIGTEDLTKITFRMIDCGFPGNIRILMNDESDKFAISFIVLDHNLAVSMVSIQENEMHFWEKLNRNENNYWFYDTGYIIEFPIKIRIYSIKGDYVTVTINEFNKERIYEADGNFKESNDTFFNITTLEKEEMPNNTRNCCERDLSVFTPIYNNGEVNEYYYINSQKVNFDYNTTEKYENRNTMRVKFQNKGKLIFQSTYSIRADQFSGVSIVIKASKNCSNCIYFNAYNLEKNINLNFDSANKWIKFRFDFESMGIKNNQFNGIILYYYEINTQPFEIYIGSIDLIGKRNKPDAGVCLIIPFSGSEGSEEDGSENIPIYIPESDDNEKTDISTIQDNNSTSIKTDQLTYIQTDIIINDINSTIINDNSSNYNEISNFTEENTEQTVDINNSTNVYNSSNCDEISNSTEENIEQTVNIDNSTHEYNSSNYIEISNSTEENNEQTIDINNSTIDFISTNYIENYTEEETEQTNTITQKIIYSPIIITNSINQFVKKGDNIIFHINPIEADKFYLENNEMIFTDNTKTKYLFLKNCKALNYNNIIERIDCSVSNNTMKGTYIEGINISIQSDKYIILQINENIGGIFMETIDKKIDKNILLSQSNNFNLTFNILYFNKSIIPYSLFPYKVVLFGKTTNKRNLEDIKYNYKINFKECRVGSYSEEEANDIVSIRCLFPDFVPAGTYNKLESDGFDVNPNSKINLVLEEDFNKSLDNFDNNQESSSSSSKTWIIWLITGIIILILIIIVIISCFSNYKKSSEETIDNSNSNNESKGNTENSNQDIHNSQ